MITRVPRIILLYWVIKIASTSLGETGADMFSMTWNLGYDITIFIFTGLFVMFFFIKMSLKKYEPITYWLTFTTTAIAGTAISDYIDRTLGLGYAVGSLILVAILIGILILWYLKEDSLSVENICTAGAESYYWTAFLVANTLGTAAGDYVADDLGLGFLQSSIFIGAVLIAIALLHLYTKVSAIILFWIAFVLSRPFGATFGDLLTKPVAHGGIDLGTVGASIFFALVLIIAIFFEIKRCKSSQGY